MYKETFANRIKSIREDLGISQTQVSKDTGIHQSFISKYENGALEPNIEQLGTLANYYQISIDWLLGNPYGCERRREKETNNE